MERPERFTFRPCRDHRRWPIWLKTELYARESYYFGVLVIYPDAPEMDWRYKLQPGDSVVRYPDGRFEVVRAKV